MIREFPGRASGRKARLVVAIERIVPSPIDMSNTDRSNTF
jgi:hypothetical protein